MKTLCILNLVRRVNALYVEVLSIGTKWLMADKCEILAQNLKYQINRQVSI